MAVDQLAVLATGAGTLFVEQVICCGAKVDGGLSEIDAEEGKLKNDSTNIVVASLQARNTRGRKRDATTSAEGEPAPSRSRGSGPSGSRTAVAGSAHSCHIDLCCAGWDLLSCLGRCELHPANANALMGFRRPSV